MPRWQFRYAYPKCSAKRAYRQSVVPVGLIINAFLITTWSSLKSAQAPSACQRIRRVLDRVQ
jgi:hypothetical protein